MVTSDQISRAGDLSLGVGGVAGVGSAGGWWEWLGANANAIGAVCAIVGLLIGIGFKMWEVADRKKMMRESETNG